MSRKNPKVSNYEVIFTVLASTAWLYFILFYIGAPACVGIIISAGLYLAGFEIATWIPVLVCVILRLAIKFLTGK